ncbi:MAG TPA: NAD(P)(+) transhydrogenase (Re/Si-specific) subunit alpha, partial [Vicinamibacteria bacterium]|nr:NAD(P)(+) transhydrogenase (Re/Si-specific) subunit alpha [Vicinamibacteria bacterium]
MKVAVLKETQPGERRVALVPGSLAPLVKAGVEIVVEKGAGAAAGYPDAEYAGKGATVAPDRASALAGADVVAMVRPLGGQAPLEGLRAGQVVVGFLDPLGRPEGARRLAEAKLTAFALELIPRTTRAQAMDVLSSAATIV